MRGASIVVSFSFILYDDSPLAKVPFVMIHFFFCIRTSLAIERCLLLTPTHDRIDARLLFLYAALVVFSF